MKSEQKANQVVNLTVTACTRQNRKIKSQCHEFVHTMSEFCEDKYIIIFMARESTLDYTTYHSLVGELISCIIQSLKFVIS